MTTIIVYGASEEVLQQVRESPPGVELIRGEDRLSRINSLRSEYVQGPDSAGPGDFAPPVDEYGPPGREGYYWARWHTPCPGTADNGECCNPDEWQVCQVFENCLDEASPGHLMVFVPGVERAQPLDAFEWGREVRRD